MERQRKGSEQRERNVEEIIEANRMSVKILALWQPGIH